MIVTVEEIAGLVALQLGAKRALPHHRIVEDLGAESADVLNLVVALESRYGIRIAEEEVPALSTVADCHRLVAERSAEGGASG